MPRVIHFEIQTDDAESISDFYGTVFGWIITAKETKDYWLIRTGPNEERGINGGIKKASAPTKGIIPTIDVDDINLYLSKVTSNGGKIVREKFTLPGTGHLAYCEDPAGNVFTILQYDSSAK